VRPSCLPTSICALLVLALMLIGAGRDESHGPMTVVIDRLPQCPNYGTGYEQPMRIDLVRDGAIVESAFHSGMYTGDASLRVGFVFDEAPGGRYEVHFGRCPSLVDDPAGAVACDDVEWFATARARLTAGDGRQTIRPRGLSARCLDGERTVRGL